MGSLSWILHSQPIQFREDSSHRLFLFLQQNSQYVGCSFSSWETDLFLLFVFGVVQCVVSKAHIPSFPLLVHWSRAHCQSFGSITVSSRCELTQQSSLWRVIVSFGMFPVQQIQCGLAHRSQTFLRQPFVIRADDLEFLFYCIEEIVC